MPGTVRKAASGCFLSSVFCLLSSVFCLLSSVFCLLFSVFCFLSSVFCFLVSVHRRPGGDLLSHAFRRSTIGAEGFHGRVRDGIGCIAPRQGHQAIDERCAKRTCSLQFVWVGSCWLCRSSGGIPRYTRDPGSVPDGWVVIKPIERLGPVSCTRYRASTPGLSTWWSSTALERDPVLRGASRLDAFSGYPVRA